MKKPNPVPSHSLNSQMIKRDVSETYTVHNFKDNKFITMILFLFSSVFVYYKSKK